MGEKMTLEDVRSWLVGKERMYVGYQRWATSLNEQEVRAFRAAIDAHLATPAQTVDIEAIKDVIRGLKGINYTIWADKLAQAIGDKT